jgi:hypothetical protein
VLIVRSTTNSSTGAASEPPPLRSRPASARASTAPVGSLNADSAITVCASRSRSREATNSGIRIAGSVGESTAPISRAAYQGRSKARCAATPTIAAVRNTPGTTSIPSPTHTRRRTPTERLSPP